MDDRDFPSNKEEDDLGKREVSTETLQLRLLHSHGDARDGVLSIPPDGAGMGEALALGGERLDPAQRLDADLCRIVWQAKGWCLIHGSAALVCALNGARVPAQATIVIGGGDTLELGLLRFGVESDNLASPVSTLAAQATRPDSAEPQFDLRDLAGAANDTGAPDAVFGVLGMAGAERLQGGDALADVLGEWLDELPRRRPARPPTSSATPARALQGTSQESDGLLAGDYPPPGTGRPPDAGAMLLAELHQEFVRVVRDPTQLASQTDWQGAIVSRSEGPAATIEELNPRADLFPMLLDIINPPRPIDQVLGSFDTMLPVTLTAEPQPDDVLRLFAPQLAREAKPTIPSLTRREHHAMSPDSHMDLGSFRPEEKNDI